MSAYIVEREHILYLVKAAASRALTSQHGPALSWVWNVNHKTGEYQRETFHGTESMIRIANVLWDENRISVGNRYRDSESLPGPVGENYTTTAKDFSAPLLHVDPVQVLKACDCYEYQSCEHKEWEKSEAYAFINALRRRAIKALPGYEKAEWGPPRGV